MKKITALLFCFAGSINAMERLTDASKAKLTLHRTTLIEELTKLSKTKTANELEEDTRKAAQFAKYIELQVVLKQLGESPTNPHNLKEAKKALERAQEKEAFFKVKLRKSTTPRPVSCPDTVTRTPENAEEGELAAAFAPLGSQQLASSSRRTSSCPEAVRPPRIPTPFPYTMSKGTVTPAIDETAEEDLDVTLTQENANAGSH